MALLKTSQVERRLWMIPVHDRAEPEICINLERVVGGIRE